MRGAVEIGPVILPILVAWRRVHGREVEDLRRPVAAEIGRGRLAQVVGQIADTGNLESWLGDIDAVERTAARILRQPRQQMRADEARAPEHERLHCACHALAVDLLLRGKSSRGKPPRLTSSA